jgi:hypothetical protein
MKDLIYLIVVSTLAVVILGVVSSLMLGLFDDRVDNKEIFALIGPSFNTIIGCFVGLIAGKMLADKPPPP